MRKSICRAAILVSLLSLAACNSAQKPSAVDQPTQRTTVSSGSTVMAQPSFDCAKAQSDAEKMVCGDADLAALDHEVARLYRLAETDPHNSKEELDGLRTTQRGWIKGRNDCWKAGDRRQCIETNYGTRILELRQGYKNARSQDGAGISLGPRSLACDGYGMGIVFIAPQPGYAVIRSATNTIMLKQQPSGSGTRYAGKSLDGDYAMATKGEDAILEQPGKSPAQCRIEEIG